MASHPFKKTFNISKKHSTAPCGQLVNNMGAIVRLAELPTIIHNSINNKVMGEKWGINSGKKVTFINRLCGQPENSYPHYPQASTTTIRKLFFYDVVGSETDEQNARAVFSECQRYRYLLRRDVPPLLTCERGAVLFIMLNPSTADWRKNDPTIRRCIGFAQSWGARRLIVANIFAWRATAPKDMKAAADPVGPDNRHFIQQAVQEATGSANGMVVAAWGTHGAFRSHSATVKGWLREMGKPVYCLGMTEGKQPQPRHPLFVEKIAQPVPYDVGR